MKGFIESLTFNLEVPIAGVLTTKSTIYMSDRYELSIKTTLVLWKI